ncbi:MAG: 3-oxoacyl-ACP reductase FabG [Syntrophales bacterium]|jgi:3-oxoacyl-[acyl-carrier protein] reductase|nr:3-oxoacyl-ACP reductase FabG [Syntrophales bacterium]MCK9527611.1 3-oxoacyl-ACP reductase FabG [Syntrophales bacterium]MDX9922228.1 3-oxoacyl-ACP reductase family protein [Syntrophales bacterium]
MGHYSDLKNRVVVVTGGSGDLGEALCREMSRQGCIVYLTYKASQSRAEDIVGGIQTRGGRSKAVYCDVTSRSHVEDVVDGIVSEEGAIDVLINNAGICRDNLFLLMKDYEFNEVIRTNLYGVYNVTKSVSSHMSRRQSGVIINISSLSGLVPAFGQLNYSASKGAVISLSRVLAIELAHNGIRVNTIAPGFFESAMTKRVPRDILKQTIRASALKRLGKAHELAKVAAFLASEDASYITGQTLVVDGGLYMK